MRTPVQIVKDDKTVRFTHYLRGELWYETVGGFAFPVPIADIGEATFLAEDKALLFLRYIRIHHAMLTAARESVEEAV